MATGDRIRPCLQRPYLSPAPARGTRIASLRLAGGSSKAIDIADGNPLGRPTPQDIELMPNGQNFGLRAQPNSPATAYQINLRSRRPAEARTGQPSSEAGYDSQ
jgi:hypothetical protein